MPKLTERMKLAEFPNSGKVHMMGELLFLAMRSGDYARLPMHRFKDVIEPLIDHKMVQVFRLDDVARGALLWARFSPEAERRFVAGEQLEYDEWISGDTYWVVGLMAPYQGVMKIITRWIEQGDKVPSQKYRFLRLKPGTGKIQRIVEVDWAAEIGERIKMLPIAEFEK